MSEFRSGVAIEGEELQLVSPQKNKESRIDGITYSFRIAFTQQVLNLWKPHETLGYGLIWIAVVGLIFVGFGALLLALANDLTEVRLRYDDTCGDSRTCTVSFTLPTSVSAPVYLYYEINSFYQNYRQLFDSKSYRQLEGLDLPASSLSSCGNIVLNSNINTRQSIGNNFLDQGAVVYPCGGMAKSFFNDNFKLFKMSDGGANTQSFEILLSSKGISYPGDLARFKNLPGTSKLQRQWVDVTDERFVVWMRNNPGSTTKKLWASVGRSVLDPGRYQIEIENNWSSSRYKAQKFVILNQVNAFGGKNTFLGNSFISLGALSLFVVIMLAIRKFVRPKGILHSHLSQLRRAAAEEF